MKLHLTFFSAAAALMCNVANAQVLTNEENSPHLLFCNAANDTPCEGRIHLHGADGALIDELNDCIGSGAGLASPVLMTLSAHSAENVAASMVWDD